MWGYTLAAAQLGVRHEVVEQLQQEHPPRRFLEGS